MQMSDGQSNTLLKKSNIIYSRELFFAELLNNKIFCYRIICGDWMFEKCAVKDSFVVFDVP